MLCMHQVGRGLMSTHEYIATPKILVCYEPEAEEENMEAQQVSG